MPCCIACCICPWTAQNLLRYQYGIGGVSDCWEECFPGCLAWMFMPQSLIFMPIIVGTKGLLVVQSCETQLKKELGETGMPSKRYMSTQANSAFSPLSC
eukprot:gene39858-52608_t